MTPSHEQPIQAKVDAIIEEIEAKHWYIPTSLLNTEKVYFTGHSYAVETNTPGIEHVLQQARISAFAIGIDANEPDAPHIVDG